MRLEINGGGKLDDSNVNGGMRADKNNFLEGAGFPHFDPRDAG